MNRDEILTKSRAENVMEDERGRLTKLESARFSHCVFLILYCLLKLFVPLDDIGDYALSLLFFGSVFSQFVYYAVKQKSISFGIFSAICCIFTLTALFSLLSALGLPDRWPPPNANTGQPAGVCVSYFYGSAKSTPLKSPGSPQSGSHGNPTAWAFCVGWW